MVSPIDLIGRRGLLPDLLIRGLTHCALALRLLQPATPRLTPKVPVVYISVQYRFGQARNRSHQLSGFSSSRLDLALLHKLLRSVSPCFASLSPVSMSWNDWLERCREVKPLDVEIFRICLPRRRRHDWVGAPSELPRFLILKLSARWPDSCPGRSRSWCRVG